jgi:hypothetical protein
MKTRFFFLLLAAVLLGSVSVKAQSETPLKGDVNEDGKVDVADIVAVIEIMKNNGGTTETTYYWYIGQTNPLTMNNISPIVTDKRSPGWRLIGTTLPTYNSSNKLWDGTQISTGTTKQTNYVALPNNTLFMYDAAGNISSGSWLLVGETEIGGLTYYVYSSVANLKTFGFNIY